MRRNLDRWRTSSGGIDINYHFGVSETMENYAGLPNQKKQQMIGDTLTVCSVNPPRLPSTMKLTEPSLRFFAPHSFRVSSSAFSSSSAPEVEL